MKQYLVLTFLLFTLAANAQVIRYDTIRVEPGDERNIYRSQEIQSSTQRPTKEYTSQEPGSGIKNANTFQFDRRKLRFGADLGMSISRNYTRLGIGPQVGYQINPYLLAGVGLKYYYTRVVTSAYELKNNLVGANVFGYVYPVRFIVFFAQPELNYIRSTMIDKTTGDEQKSSGTVPSVVVGGGLRLGRSHITLNYDLVQHQNSPHPSGFYLGVSAFF